MTQEEIVLEKWRDVGIMETLDERYNLELFTALLLEGIVNNLNKNNIFDSINVITFPITIRVIRHICEQKTPSEITGIIGNLTPDFIITEILNKYYGIVKSITDNIISQENRDVEAEACSELAKIISLKVLSL